MASASQQYRLKGLREKRGRIKSELEKLGDKLRREERAMSAEEKSAFDQLKADFQLVSEGIRTVEADILAVDEAISASEEAAGAGDEGETQPADPAEGGGQNSRRVPGRRDQAHRPKASDGTSPGELAEMRALAFQAWARHQHGLPLKRQHRAACERTGLRPNARYFDVALKRAQSTSNTLGGYTIAREFSGMLEQALKDFSSVRGVCEEFTTTTGATLDYPTEDDTSNTGALLSEATEAEFVDDTFSTVTFSSYKFSSNGILINYELLEDSAFNLEQILATQLGIRLGRAQGSYFTTGTGSSQPQGIVTGAAAGVTTAAATAIKPSELVRLEHAVDPAYRQSPGFGYMMHDSTLAYLMTLVVDSSTDQRRLVMDSWADPSSGPTTRLNGRPVYINQFMAQSSGSGGVPVTASKHVLCGDFKKFKVRDVGPVRIRRLDERYAEKDQVGFIGFMRSDSRIVNSAAIKYLLQA